MKNDRNISKVKCEHPVILVRHDIAKMVAVKGYDAIIFDGNISILRPDDIRRAKHDYFQSDEDKLFGKVINSIIGNYKEADDIDRVGLLNTTTGDVKPLLMEVPCGHCTLCRHSYIEKWVTRCMLQESFDNQKPIFITLTYNQEHYEAFRVLHGKDEIRNFHTRELQQFFKRLRQDLTRDGFLSNFKYFAVSEYGTRNKRLHYHIALYGIDPALLSKTDTKYAVSYTERQRIDCHIESRTPNIFNYIRKNWSISNRGIRRDKLSSVEYEWIIEQNRKGIVDIEESKGNTPRYITKYITKGTKEKDTVFLKSQKFGLAKILEFKEQLRKDPYISEFLIMCRGNIQTVPVSKYVIDNCYPNVNRSVKVEDRRILRHLFSRRDIIKNYISEDKYLKLTRLWYCMDLEEDDARDPYRITIVMPKIIKVSEEVSMTSEDNRRCPVFSVGQVNNYGIFKEESLNNYLEDLFSRIDPDEVFVSHLTYMEHMNSLEDLEYDIVFEVSKEKEKQSTLKRIERDGQ